MEIAPKYTPSSTGNRTVYILGEKHSSFTLNFIYACILLAGGFSEPHASVVSLVEYHHQYPIEIIGKVNILLQDPLPQ